MSSRRGPVENVLLWSLMLLAAALALWGVVWVIGQIWGWLLLGASIALVLFVGVRVALHFWRSRSSRW